MQVSFKNQVNAVGAISVGVVAAFFTYDLTRSKDAPPCSTNYKSVIEMSLTKRGGALLTPAELEARVGVGEQGVQAKASVVSDKNQPSPTAISVAVGGSVATDTVASFYWMPNGSDKAVSACLSYDFMLPAGFDYSRGGRLPGMFGGFFSGLSSPNPKSLGLRLVWNELGQLGLEGVTAVVPDQAEEQTKLRYQAEFELPRGRWVHVEQEVTMNKPGHNNGVLRLWIDGQLKLEDTTLAWRSDDTVSVSGVWADIGYRSFGGSERPAKSLTSIKVSPPRMAWQ